MRRHLLLTLAASLAAGLILVPAPSWAGDDERVAVLDFDGRGTERFERYVKKIASREARVISDSRYQRTARKLGARTMHADDVAEVAAKMELDAVVKGRLVERKGKRYLKVWVRDGAEGKVVDRFMLRARSRSLGSKARRALKKRLRRAIDEAADVTRDLRAERKMVRKKRRTSTNRSKRRRLAKKRRARERKSEARERKSKARDRRLAKKRKARDRRLAKKSKARDRRLAKKRKARDRRLAKERKARERREREAVRLANERKAENKRKAREREERAMAARAKAKYDDSGQAIDEEVPPGL